MIKFQDTFGKSTTDRKIQWEQDLENKKYTNKANPLQSGLPTVFHMK